MRLWSSWISGRNRFWKSILVNTTLVVLVIWGWGSGMRGIFCLKVMLRLSRISNYRALLDHLIVSTLLMGQFSSISLPLVHGLQIQYLKSE